MTNPSFSAASSRKSVIYLNLSLAKIPPRSIVAILTGPSMTKTVDMRVAALLNDAERRGACCAPLAQTDKIALQRRIQSGSEIVSPFPGLYSRATFWNQLRWPCDQALPIIRGLAKLHPGWTFSHVSAAVVHGLQVSGTSPKTIHIASHVKGRAPFGIQKHALSDIDAAECVSIDGVQVTSLWRTVFDCLCSLPTVEGLIIADSALRKTGRDAAWLVSDLRAKYRSHNGLSRAIAIARFADGRSENGGESHARAMIIKLGYETPELQAVFPDPVDATRSYRTDFTWWGDFDTPLVIGELDGYCKTEDDRCLQGRSTSRVLADERRRESRLSAAGAPIMRFSFSEAKNVALFERLLSAFSVPKRQGRCVCTHRFRMRLDDYGILVSLMFVKPSKLRPSDLARFKERHPTNKARAIG